MMQPHERIIACPHVEREPGAEPLMDGPLCPYCDRTVDLVGVDTVIAGGGVELTPTGLRCPCGYFFRLASTPLAPSEARP